MAYLHDLSSVADAQLWQHNMHWRDGPTTASDSVTLSKQGRRRAMQLLSFVSALVNSLIKLGPSILNASTNVVQKSFEIVKQNESPQYGSTFEWWTVGVGTSNISVALSIQMAHRQHF
jgi:hypothetical protein